MIELDSCYAVSSTFPRFADGSIASDYVAAELWVLSHKPFYGVFELLDIRTRTIILRHRNRIS